MGKKLRLVFSVFIILFGMCTFLTYAPVPTVLAAEKIESLATWPRLLHIDGTELHSQRLKGKALVKAMINKDGTVEGAWICKSSGYQSLDLKIIDIVQKATFSPARGHNGQPVKCKIEIPISVR